MKNNLLVNIYFYITIFLVDVSYCQQSAVKLRVDKTYEIFKQSEDQLDLFKLRCDFNNVNISINSNGLVYWYKLDLNNFEYIRKFEEMETKSSLSASLMDAYVLTSTESAYLNDTLTFLSPNNKLVSELIFNLNGYNSKRPPSESLNQISGIYLCMLNKPTDSFTQQSQFIQQISINELLINQEYFNYELNYKILQITNDRILLEILSLRTNRELFITPISITSNLKLVYLLANTINKAPIMRGDVDIPSSWVQPTQATSEISSRFLLLEGLYSNTSYTLSIYLKKQSSNPTNTMKNYARLILNTTITTANKDSNLNQFDSKGVMKASVKFAENEYDKKDNMNAKEYEEDEQDDNETDYDDYSDEYDDEEDLDDSMDLEYMNDDFNILNSESIIKCDLSKSFISNAKTRQNQFISNDSLFNKAKKRKKLSSQSIAVNYSPNQMNQLLIQLEPLFNNQKIYSSINQNNPSSNLSHLIDFFDLKQFEKKTMDYLIYYDCLKQYKSNPKQQSSSLLFKASSGEPICLYTPPINLNKKKDFFSIQASIQLDEFKNSLIYVSSSCQLKKQRLSRHSEKPLITKNKQEFILNQTRFLNKDRSIQSLKSLILINTPLNSTSSTTAMQSPGNNMMKKEYKASKYQYSESSVVPAAHSSIAINDCQIIPESKDMQFKIDYDPKIALDINTNARLNNKLVFYQIEITVPESDITKGIMAMTTATAANAFKDQKVPTVRNIQTLKQPFTFNLTLKKENNNSQIVRLSLNNDMSKNIIIEEDEQIFSHKNINNENENGKDLENDFEANIFSSNIKREYLGLGQSPSVQQSSLLTALLKEDKIIKSGLVSLSSTRSINNLKKINQEKYTFKVKLVTEDKNRVLGPELISVECKRMNSGLSGSDGNNSFIGLIMTCVCAVIIVIVGFLFCLIMKRKYGITQDYFRNLKKNILFKSSTSTCTSASNNDPKNYQIQLQQQQNNLSTLSNTNNIKNPLFSYQYVRLIMKKKWEARCKNDKNSNNNNENNNNDDIPIVNNNLTKNNMLKFNSLGNLIIMNENDIKQETRETTTANCDYNLNSNNQIRSIKTITTTACSTANSSSCSFSSKSFHHRLSRSIRKHFKFRSLRQASKKNCHLQLTDMIKEKNDSSTSGSSSPLILFSSAFKSCSSAKSSAIDTSSQEAEVLKQQLETCLINKNNHEIIIVEHQNKSNSFSSLPLAYKEDSDAISIDLFETYVQQMHTDNDFGFAQLYEEITASTKSYIYSSDISLLECNRNKNRYSNILTYDHSRVKISCDDRDDSCGYINANYVDGYLKANAYIATQGPMPNTFVDFWKMIMEKNCSIIVMITNVKEKGRIKCDQYWPEEGIEYYGNIQVTHLHTISLAFYTKRIFTLKIKNAKKRCNSERLIYQYHFTDWPDHGVPYYIMPVLTFIKKSSRANPEFGGPIVVHCSAGVGRTGTYIVIDAMMKQIKNKSTVNTHTFLKHIRHQRNYLVQTEEQFIFIYDVLVESLKSGETELTEHNYKSFINGLSRVINDDGLKLIDRQFQLITEFKPKDYQVSCAQMPFNLEKNRNQRIIPVNNSRVVLSKRPGVDGSEYINASYLHGASRQDEFIITQYPTKETKCSFWQMVWDNNSNLIVVLNSDETESCDLYWLPIGECMKCDTFTVILREENFDMDFVIRDFLLQSIDEDYEFNCKMITACYWPDSCAPIKTSFDLINKVKSYNSTSQLNTSQNQNATLKQITTSPTINTHHIQNGGGISNGCISSQMTLLPPLIVHDLYGGHRAATFCALYALQDLIQMENSVNVYELAKMFHLKRPEVWLNRSNIMFLYEAVECLFEEMHSNHQFQFKNFLNSNIENHFNMLNLNYQNSIHFNGNNINNKTANTLSMSGNIKKSNSNNNNHVSLSLLPIITQNGSLSPNSQTTVTLPSLSTKMPAQSNKNLNNLNKANINNNSSSGIKIGSRLYNFQNNIQQMRFTTTQHPSNNSNERLDPQNHGKLSNINQDVLNNNHKGHNHHPLIDIPKILPSFLNIYSSGQSNVNNNNKEISSRFSLNKRIMKFNNSNDSNNNSNNNNDSNTRNSKAIKFMNTMKLKSASIKRALFPQSTSSNQQSSAIHQDISSESVNLKDSKINQSKSQIDEKKTQIIIGLSSESSSGSSSSSTSSSSTETESSLSAKTHAYTSPIILPSINLQINKSKSNLNLPMISPISSNIKVTNHQSLEKLT